MTHNDLFSNDSSAATEARRIAVLISGRGSNMAALVTASRQPDSPFTVALVASDKPDAPGLVWAQEQGIATFARSPRGMSKTEYEAILDRELRAAGVELIALAGYMRILSPWLIAHWPERILNIHPSLLPRYKGLDTHARALAAGDSEAGASVHIVTAELDAGTVLGQAKVPILPGDTPDTLAERVLAQEHRLYPRIVAEYLQRC